ncbi:unnamed protein product [Caenorhabditis nigoni]
MLQEGIAGNKSYQNQTKTQVSQRLLLLLQLPHIEPSSSAKSLGDSISLAQPSPAVKAHPTAEKEVGEKPSMSYADMLCPMDRKDNTASSTSSSSSNS